jgi:5'-3' exonuclease
MEVAENRRPLISLPIILLQQMFSYLNELFRAHYSPRPEHYAPSGRNAKAAVGVVESQLALLHDAEEAVTHLAVVFDNPIRSFRDLFQQYKRRLPPRSHNQCRVCSA